MDEMKMFTTIFDKIDVFLVILNDIIKHYVLTEFHSKQLFFTCFVLFTYNFNFRITLVLVR